MPKRLLIRLYKCVLRAIPRSLSICVWLLKVMLPISLAVRILQHVGFINWLAGWLTPVFSYIGLSGDSAFVFLTSIFLPLSPTIAVMTTLTITLREATILAVIAIVYILRFKSSYDTGISRAFRLSYHGIISHFKTKCNRITENFYKILHLFKKILQRRASLVKLAQFLLLFL